VVEETIPDFKAIASKYAGHKCAPMPCKGCGKPWIPAENYGTYKDDDWRWCDGCWFMYRRDLAGVRSKFFNARIKDFSPEFRKLLEVYKTKSAFLWGDRGVGKSHAVSALVNERVLECLETLDGDGLKSRGIPNILIIQWAKLKRTVQNQYNDDSEESGVHLMKRLSKVKRLIIDDFSDTLGPESSSVKTFVAELVDNRYSDEMVTTFTSNLSLEGIASQFEEKVSDRIYEMCGIGERVKELVLPNRRLQKK
jgi:DNA replication protein DnaC